MNLVYIHQYFETPEESGRTRSYWLAKKLVEHGHNVTIITSTHSNSARSEGLYTIEGIQVRYIKNAYDNSMSKIEKIMSFIRFMTISTWYCINEKNVDLVYATSTPLTVGIPALINKWVKKVDYIFEVRDLWPEFPIQIKAINNKTLINLLKRFEKKIYKCSVHVVALSPGMKDGVVKTGISESKVTVIPNMSKPDLFYPRSKNIDVQNKYSLRGDQFNVIHFGTMGVANGLDYIIEAAKLLSKEKNTDIQFYFAGKGAMEEELKAEVSKCNLNNVHFLGYMNTFEISEVVNCCDVTITSFKKLPILDTNSPNKFFDALSSGKPVIVNSSGWTKDLVIEKSCGIYVNVDLPQELVDAIKYLKTNPELATEMGKNARELSISEFDKEKLSHQFYKLIEDFHNVPAI